MKKIQLALKLNSIFSILGQNNSENIHHKIISICWKKNGFANDAKPQLA